MPTKDFLSGAKPVPQQDDFLNGAQQYVEPTEGATIGPAQPEPWINQLEEDVRSGGGRTLPGRILGYMQRRGSKGYSGLESGVSKGAADFVGSPELGALKWAQGVSELPTHPLEGLLHEGEGAWNASQIPMAFAGGPEADAAINAIPSRAHAVSVLNDIEQAGRNTPVYMENTEPALEKFGEHVAAGGKNAKVMNLLRKRIATAGETAQTPKVVSQPRIAGLLEAPERDISLNRGVARGSTKGNLFDAEINPEEPMEPRSGNVFAPISEYPGINPHFLSGSEHPELSGRFAPPSGVLRTREPLGGKVPVDEFGRMSFEPTPFAEAPQPEGEPINFPEARRFYTNVSDVTRRPGFLGRAFESSRNPRMRMMAGGVREGLHSDLTNAAQSLGRGEDYANAIKEYAQNAKLRGFLRKSGIALLPTAAGVLGARKAYDLARTIGW